MAKGKKSFIFYSNWRDTFEAIPPEKGYELLMHILKYVNDENPETECVMVNALFQSFKSTLKADLEKWEAQRKQRSEAGNKSAESRKRKSTSVNERERNSTVNVIVNDIVNVIDYKELLSFINKTLGRSFRVIPESTKNKYKARLKEGFTKSDIQKAILNASKDSYHIDTNYKYLTPEFFSRPSTLDKYCNVSEISANEKVSIDNWQTNPYNEDN